MLRSVRWVTLLVLAGSVGTAGLATACDTCGGKSKPAVLIPGLGKHHHPVSTKNALAQRFFDQGLTLLFAFNHDEAVRSFKRAVTLDPKLAMGYWGIALALGPNYNMPADPAMAKAAYDAAQKARSLAAGASERERAYIEAVAKRCSPDPKADGKKLLVAYKEAMGALVQRYPDDLDAATLYAESAMNLRPWQLYSADGTPAEGTGEIVSTLEGVLKRNPDHPGANHHYIHAVEASLYPERGVPSAIRLQTLVPAAGHLVHMPAHIWIRIGEYAAAARSNRVAAGVDREYIQKNGIKGIYPQMYYSHNLHFLAVAHGMQGRYADARKAAEQLVTHIQPHVKNAPPLEVFMPTDTLILVRFGRWDEILSSPEPVPTMQVTRAMWRFARGLAYTAKGDLKRADAERERFLVIAAKIPADMRWGNSTARGVLAVAENMLDGRIAVARGDRRAAIASLRRAVAAEDALKYNEPMDWYLPAREPLGAVLLADGQAAEAERVFRANLQKYARDGRSLLGVHESLKAQGKHDAARLVQQQFQVAWQQADTPFGRAELLGTPGSPSVRTSRAPAGPRP